MFGIGSTELLVILVVALIVLGPKSLASVSRTLGKAMGEFRRVSTDFQRTLNVEAAEEEARQNAAKRREAAAREAAEQRQQIAQNRPGERQAPDSVSLSQGEAGPPPDSPLGQALAKARTQAAAKPETLSNNTPDSNA